jgi:uncharacterized protein (TIGR03435 family)
MKKIASLSLLIVLATMHASAQQPKFELADVHVSATPRWFAQNNGGLLRDGRYINRDATLLNLIEAAWGVKEDGVAGGPSWLDTDIYDVIAKVPAGATPADAKLMLQSLLAERFAIVVRNDKVPMPRYVLTVGKSGSKLKAATGSDEPGCQQKQTGTPGRGDVRDPGSIPDLKLSCRNLTSAQIAENLHQMAGGPINTYLPREVFDSTGLEGKWDFDLEFTPIGIIDLKGREGTTLFDAVSKQLGLNLELKDVPVPALMVQGANRKPTPNGPGIAANLGVTEPRFEAAIVKPANPDVRLAGNVRGSELRFVANVKTLIGQAYFVQPNAQNDEIIGLPKFAETQLWDVTAKLPSSGDGAPVASGGPRPQPPPRAVVMEMLRGLLEDQFELKVHKENREATVYAMTVAGKPKMTQATGTERMSCKADPNAVKPYPDMVTMVRCTNITMAEFAENLEQVTGYFDHPIVDATGLKGGWNFLFGFSRNQAQRPPNPNQQAGEPADPIGLTTYEAVERMLGVKLVKQKRSIPVIVVDHVAEKPVE